MNHMRAFSNRLATAINVYERIMNHAKQMLSIGFGIFTLLAPPFAYSDEPMQEHTRVPGVIIDYIPAATQQYIGCPSLVIMEDGSYAASHSFFGLGSTNDVSVVFSSHDKGATWEKLTELKGQWWSTLFLYQNGLYIMGVDKEYGRAVIRKSLDGGKSWTNPVDEKSGLLISQGEYHCAPVPVVEYEGRIWRAMEERNPPEGWPDNLVSFVMSAPLGSDLLDARNWRASNRLRFDKAVWPGIGWLEGNIVIAPDGSIKNILRVHGEADEKAAVADVSPDGATVSFEPASGFVDFPGGSKKFTIRWDSTAKAYYTLSNYIPENHKGGRPDTIRNTLALASSPNLRDWSVRSIILYVPDVLKSGFQYIDWQVEGKNIIFVSRTAYDDGVGGAHNFHDANYFTFHRIPDFRNRTLQDPMLE